MYRNAESEERPASKRLLGLVVQRARDEPGAHWHEGNRDPRIAWHFGAAGRPVLAPPDKHCRPGEPEEDPIDEDDVPHEPPEGPPREHQRARPGRLKNDGSNGSTPPRMNVRQTTEEEASIRHRPIQARGRQHVDPGRPERADGNR